MCFHLRVALEAMVNCGTHILGRIPGEQISVYKEIGPKLAKYHIISKKMDEKLAKMAAYRNRLVHFYYKVSGNEVYEILQNNLSDFQQFCKEMLRFLASFRY